MSVRQHGGDLRILYCKSHPVSTDSSLDHGTEHLIRSADITAVREASERFRQGYPLHLRGCAGEPSLRPTQIHLSRRDNVNEW